MTGDEAINSAKARDIAALMFVTALSRFLFRSQYLYDIDSVNLALALRRFDPSVHQPHPPGYFLYVCLGRLFNIVFHDANTALITISIVFSCGAAAMIYILADTWFGRQAAVFAGLIFLFSPLIWFHGTVALTYIVEAFFSALVGYLCWQASHNGRYFLPAAMAVGAAAGFRPSSIIFLGPVLVFSFRHAGRRQIAAGICVLGLTLAAWFLPMIRLTGGSAYFSSLVSLWSTVPAKDTIFNSSVLNSVARAGVIAFIYVLGFGTAAILPFLGLNRSASVDRSKVTFTLVWITPGLLFFTFIFLKFVNSGYLLIVAPPVCAWMGLWASRWYEIVQISRLLKLLVIGSSLAANSMIFIFAPFYFSYREVRRFETELRTVICIVPRLAPASEAMIVGLDSHFLGYRHAGYYLPGYLTAQFPEVHLAAGMRVFTMQDGDTRLESQLVTTSVKNFIIFPLPLGDSAYRDYLGTLRKRFPAGALRTVSSSGYEFMTGSVADLHFLFPTAASALSLPLTEAVK